MKGGFGPPDRYLGAIIDKFQFEDVRTFSCMNCAENLCGDIKNVDLMLKVNKAALNYFGDRHCPYTSSYIPEFGVTNELDTKLIIRFQRLIEALSW